MVILSPRPEVVVEGDGAIREIQRGCTSQVCMMLKEVLVAVLQGWFLLDEPIHQVWRAETSGGNEGQSMRSSLHFKFLKLKVQIKSLTL